MVTDMDIAGNIIMKRNDTLRVLMNCRKEQSSGLREQKINGSTLKT